MHTIIMSRLNGDAKGIAFRMENITQIIKSSETRLLSGKENSGGQLEWDGRLFSVRQEEGEGPVKPYFILHSSGEAFNVSDYRLLFYASETEDRKVSGMDTEGKRHLCAWSDVDLARGGGSVGMDPEENASGKYDQSQGELEDLQVMIRKFKSGEFYEALTNEFSGRIKVIAQELIDFRRDIQNRFSPGILEMAAKDIPEASNQLEGINKTLETSTMKIMDINDEQLELANKRLEFLNVWISENGTGPEENAGAMAVLREELEVLKTSAGLAMAMMEPLSFQDLVGQRIQRIIRLVKSMESRINELVISFGIKIQKHRENPERSFEDLSRDVEVFKSELKGPQNDGRGLDQADIDALLATL